MSTLLIWIHKRFICEKFHKQQKSFLLRSLATGNLDRRFDSMSVAVGARGQRLGIVVPMEAEASIAPTASFPRVVIVGGGFGGLQAAKELADKGVRVTVVDRTNHHLFQPLLYQVATAGLSPADIAQPIRHILKEAKNIEVVMGEVDRIHVNVKKVYTTTNAAFSYDYLIVAAGARHSYFGHDEWERFAPGLKSLEDALELRRRILNAFEAAEMAESDADRRAALTFVVVGAGPTGVEMAGAVAELA